MHKRKELRVSIVLIIGAALFFLGCGGNDAEESTESYESAKSVERSVREVELPAGEFNDVNLQEVIKQELELEDEEEASAEELKGLTRFVASEEGITDIAGIEHLVNLERLNLRGNEIDNIAYLSEMNELEDLRLNSNNIPDLSPLADLKNLRSLNLANNEVVDLSPLLDLPRLEKVDVRNNPLDESVASEQINALIENGVEVKHE